MRLKNEVYKNPQIYTKKKSWILLIKMKKINKLLFGKLILSTHFSAAKNEVYKKKQIQITIIDRQIDRYQIKGNQKLRERKRKKQRRRKEKKEKIFKRGGDYVIMFNNTPWGMGGWGEVSPKTILSTHFSAFLNFINPL